MYVSIAVHWIFFSFSCATDRHALKTTRKSLAHTIVQPSSSHMTSRVLQCSPLVRLPNRGHKESRVLSKLRSPQSMYVSFTLNRVFLHSLSTKTFLEDQKEWLSTPHRSTVKFAHDTNNPPMRSTVTAAKLPSGKARNYSMIPRLRARREISEDITGTFCA